MTRRQHENAPDGDGATITISRRLALLALGAVVVVAGAYLLGQGAATPGVGGTTPAPATVPAADSGPSQGPPGLAFTVPRGNATAAPVAPATGGARLAVDNSRLDFGAKAFGEPVNARFTVTNVGDQDLRIDDKVAVTTVVGC